MASQVLASQTHTARPTDRIVEILGWLALFSCLALLSPGLVVKASAEPNSSQAVSEGASCSAGEASAERTTLHLQQQLAALQAQAIAEAGQGGTGGVVMLNNSGFNYRPTPSQEAAEDSAAEGSQER